MPPFTAFSRHPPPSIRGRTVSRFSRFIPAKKAVEKTPNRKMVPCSESWNRLALERLTGCHRCTDYYYYRRHFTLRIREKLLVTDRLRPGMLCCFSRNGRRVLLSTLSASVMSPRASRPRVRDYHRLREVEKNGFS